jgi:2'-5' RNA ligase
MIRLFATIAIPDATAERLRPLQVGVAGAHWVARADLHLTLRFIGEIDERLAEDVDAELTEIRHAPFRIVLRGAGFFGGETPHALWIGTAPDPALDELHRKVERACRRAGLPPDPRVWKPHVTLARLTATPLAHAMAFERRLATFQAAPFDVEAFELWSSHRRRGAASVYAPETRYPLTPAAPEKPA